MVMSPLLMVIMSYRIHNHFHFFSYICRRHDFDIFAPGEEF